MLRIGVWGNSNNYFFNEVVEALSIKNEIVYDFDRQNVDFIFCVNDIKPLIKDKSIPVVTWISERITWTYFWKNLGVNSSCLYFVTEKTFVNDIKGLTGNNNVFFLPLATSFKRKSIANSYKYDVSFIGNVMKKQAEIIEKNESFLTLPFKSEDYRVIKDEIWKKKWCVDCIDVYSFVEMVPILCEYRERLLKHSKVVQDLFYGYIGMLLTMKRRIFFLDKVKLEQSNITLFPKTWEEVVNEVMTFRNIPYKDIWKIYNNSRINLNISSMHMPSSLNSRVFDVPICGGFLLTDYREGLYELFNKDEIVVYHTLEELLEYIEFFKKNDSERRKIIEKGMERIEKDHSYINRVDYIVKTCMKVIL